MAVRAAVVVEKIIIFFLLQQLFGLRPGTWIFTLVIKLAAGRCQLLLMFLVVTVVVTVLSNNNKSAN